MTHTLERFKCSCVSAVSADGQLLVDSCSQVTVPSLVGEILDFNPTRSFFSASIRKILGNVGL